MKILFSLLAFCLFASCVHSQEAVDTVSVRVQYRALYKHTQEQKEAYDDINLLDIGRHSSRFYSQRFEQFLHLRDSVKSVNTDPMSFCSSWQIRLALRKDASMKFISTFHRGALSLIRIGS